MSPNAMILSLFAVVFFSCSLHGQILMTVPKGDLGFVYKPTTSPRARLAAYLDLSCPDSRDSFPTLTEVADHYKDNLELRVYIFSLPYHRNSHTLAKATNVLHDYFISTKSSKTVFDWFRLIYKNLDKITSDATAQMTDPQVLNRITSLAKEVSNISTEAFQTGVANRAIDVRARTEWKYGCTRGVFGTPMFTLNDVFVMAGSTWTVEQWVKLIDPVM